MRVLQRGDRAPPARGIQVSRIDLLMPWRNSDSDMSSSPRLTGTTSMMAELDILLPASRPCAGTARKVTIEVLTPDFQRKPGAIEAIADAGPDVFNHNLETVPRLYRTVRRAADYGHSLQILRRMRDLNSEVFTKSGLMVGLGETNQEILDVMDDMRTHDVDFLTIGQYLQPTLGHHPVDRFVPPEEFPVLASEARAKGFLVVSASPLTRSSYHADQDFRKLQEARRAARRKRTGGIAFASASTSHGAASRVDTINAAAR